MANTPVFSSKPYFDDFDPSDQFMRILFRPGYAVQARELTQSQTILQDQIGNFADHIFENGTVVIPGAVTINNNLSYVRLDENTPLSQSDKSVYLGALVYDGNGNKAKIVKVIEAEGGDPDTLYVSYTENAQGSVEFANQASLTIDVPQDGGGTVAENVDVEADQGTWEPTGVAFAVEVNDGVYYLNSLFVRVGEQMTVIEKYRQLRIDKIYSIGFHIPEEVITPEDDSDLLDNAQGSPNETAPGAHRFKVSPELMDKNDAPNLKNFVEVTKIKYGDFVEKEERTDYSVLEETLARRTFDESGNYTVRDFQPSLDANPNDDTKFLLNLTSGKAYVRGFEISTSSQITLDMDKARDTESETNTLLPLQYGNVLYAKNLVHAPEPYQVIETYDSYKASASDDTATGTALGIKLTVGDVRYDAVKTAEEGQDVFAIRIISIDSSGAGSSALADIKSFEYIGAPNTAGDVADVGQDGAGNTILENAQDNTLIYKYPFDWVQSNDDITYNIWKHFAATVDSNSEVTITLSAATDQFRDETDDFLIAVEQVNNASTPASAIEYVGIPDSVVLSNNNQTATLDLTSSGLLDTDNVVIHATVFRELASTNIRQKTKTTNTETNLAVDGNGQVQLANTDVYKLVSVKDTNDSTIDYTDRFTLVPNATKTFYFDSYIELKDNTTVGVNVDVEYEYYSHSSGDFFLKESYVDTDYEDIPTFTDSAQNTIRLADSMDFRRDASGSTANYFSNGTPVPVANREATLDITYYLPRIDIVTVDKNGAFEVTQGDSSLEAKAPQPKQNAMKLMEFTLQPYTASLDENVELRRVDNKRYTMSDIGDIEKRISKLEYYSALSLLESATVDKEFVDKFKNGIIVDPFDSHKVGAVSKDAYDIAVNPRKGEARPRAVQKAHELQLRTDPEGGAGDAETWNTFVEQYATLPYQEFEMISQPLASQKTRLNPFIKFTWQGSLVLHPSTDVWYTDIQKPDLFRTGDTIETEKFKNNKHKLGTQWNSWETTYVEEGEYKRQRRTGTEYFKTERTENEFVNNTIVERSPIPYIRSRDVKFVADGMKPNTDIKAYFDNVDVSSYCIPDGGNVGDQLTTDGSGSIEGHFRIPNEQNGVRFRCGVKKFVLTDDPKTGQTAAAADYNARGTKLYWQKDYLVHTIVDLGSRQVDDTRKKNISTGTGGSSTCGFSPGCGSSEPADANEKEMVQLQVAPLPDGRTTRWTSVEDLQTNYDQLVNALGREPRAASWKAHPKVNRWAKEPGDPLAQSFSTDLPGGAFIASIEVFFGTEASNNTHPVRVELRGMENGYPAAERLATAVLHANEISGSDDASVASIFRFDAPIYIEEDKEYCFVLITDSETLTVWTSKLGEIDVATNEQITRQTFLGSMFKSQNNSTWSAVQTEDMKFNVYRCIFDPDTSYTAYFVPGSGDDRAFQTDDLEQLANYSRLFGNPFYFEKGSDVIKVFDEGHGFSSGDTVRLEYDSNNVTGTDSINGFTASAIGGAKLSGSVEHTVIDHPSNGEVITKDYYFVQISGESATETGFAGGNDWFASSFTRMCASYLNAEPVAPEGTTIKWDVKPTDASSRSISSSYVPHDMNDTLYWKTPQIITSYYGAHQTEAGADKYTNNSLTVRATLSTRANNLSPLISTENMAFIGIDNYVDNNKDDDNKAQGYNASARYMTKKVELADPANELQVYFDANRPAGSDIEVFYKVLYGTSQEGFEAAAWHKMTASRNYPVNENKKNFTEYKYVIQPPEGDFTEYAIKVVFTTGNDAQVPRIKNFRALALTS